MSRYNSQFSGSQIDSAISNVLSGYQIAVLTSSLNISGSLNVYGDITASNARITASLWVSSSTKFGNTSTDVHQFTGSLNILSGSTKFEYNGDTYIDFQDWGIGGTRAIFGVNSQSLLTFIKGTTPTTTLLSSNGDVKVGYNQYGILSVASSNGVVVGNTDYGVGAHWLFIASGSDSYINGNFRINGSLLGYNVLNKLQIGHDTALTGSFEVNGDTQLTGSLNVSGSIEPISGSSLILLSPNGTRFKLTVDDFGVVSSSLA